MHPSYHPPGSTTGPTVVPQQQRVLHFRLGNRKEFLCFICVIVCVSVAVAAASRWSRCVRRTPAPSMQTSISIHKRLNCIIARIHRMHNCKLCLKVGLRDSMKMWPVTIPRSLVPTHMLISLHCPVREWHKHKEKKARTWLNFLCRCWGLWWLIMAPSLCFYYRMVVLHQRVLLENIKYV